MRSFSRPGAVFAVSVTVMVVFLAAAPWTSLYGACAAGRCADWLDVFGGFETMARTMYVGLSWWVPAVAAVLAARTGRQLIADRTRAAEEATGPAAGDARLRADLSAIVLVAPLLAAAVAVAWVATLS